MARSASRSMSRIRSPLGTRRPDRPSHSPRRQPGRGGHIAIKAGADRAEHIGAGHDEHRIVAAGQRDARRARRSGNDGTHWGAPSINRYTAPSRTNIWRIRIVSPTSQRGFPRRRSIISCPHGDQGHWHSRRSLRRPIIFVGSTALGRGCVKTSDRNGNEQRLCSGPCILASFVLLGPCSRFGAKPSISSQRHPRGRRYGGLRSAALPRKVDA